MNSIEIVVNGVSHSILEDRIKYEELVQLAFNTYDPKILYTVLYYSGKSDHVKGSLVVGEDCKVHPGMIFNVTITTQS